MILLSFLFPAKQGNSIAEKPSPNTANNPHTWTSISGYDIGTYRGLYLDLDKGLLRSTDFIDLLLKWQNSGQKCFEVLKPINNLNAKAYIKCLQNNTFIYGVKLHFCDVCITTSTCLSNQRYLSCAYFPTVYY